MKILILGHGDHGKDSVAELLKQFTGLTYITSSMAAATEAVYPYLPHYPSVEACYNDRRSHRLLWKRLISAYNTPDKGRLCREILKQNDCYVGMRCAEEYAETRHLFDHILWVDASERKPLDESMGIVFDPQLMVKIDNNGPMDETAHNLLEWAREVQLCE